MDDVLEDEVEIKVEYYDTYEADPLSHRRHAAEHRQLESNNDACSETPNGQFLDDGANRRTIIDVNMVASKPESEATWHRKQNTSGRYLCKFCELSYLSVQTLRHHVKTKHPDKAKVLKSIITRNKRNSKLKCHICKKRFYILSELKSHVTVDHNKELIQFSCYFCNAAFSNGKEIENHLYLKHEKDIKVVKLKYCNLCGYRTLKRSHFTQHLNTHFQDKTVSCQFCDYATDRTANLKIHERIHMDLKPYSCDYKDCNYKSAAKSALRSHQLKHKRDENMLYCDKCNYKTVYKQSLKKHCENHLNSVVISLEPTLS